MKQNEFTSDDWDYIMKKNPELRKKHEEILFFNKTNPILAEEIDKECRKQLRKDGQTENKTD